MKTIPIVIGVLVVIGLGVGAGVVLLNNHPAVSPPVAQQPAPPQPTPPASGGDVPQNPDGLPKVYADAKAGFTIHYPSDYTLDESYTYQNLGPGKEINGVKFTIPASLAQGTNLSNDTYVSVENLPKATVCSAALFVEPGGSDSTVQEEQKTIDGVQYSVASSMDAAAGNRYEETVYALPGTSPCIAIRSFIHYGVLENYDPGTVKAFDRDTLLNTFNAMRRSLMITQ